MLKKSLLIAIFSLLITTANAAYTSVDCSTDNSFGEYSCNQCFNGGEIKAGDNISFLDDLWVNDTTNKKIMYKEEQTMPVMNSLNGANFSKNPNSDSFWEYTPEFEALKNAEFDGYVLSGSQNVSWIKSALGASYKVENAPEKGQNAGMLVFDITSHNILASGEITMDDKVHKECVLFKAGETVSTPAPAAPVEKKEPKPKPEEMTKVKTGPEMYFLVLIISFLLGIAFMNRKMILQKVKK